MVAEDFADSGIVFLSFVHGEKKANHTRILRARLEGHALVDVETVFTTQPAKSGDAHNGGRMFLMGDGTLLMGLGDGFYFREESQKLDSHMGTIVRVGTDGSIPRDNPFVNRAGALPHIYSYGHRHVQAIVRDPFSGRLYAHEHGPRGGDELNLIEPGRNYGWPLITYGRDYSRSLITPFTAMPGMEQPLLHWTPSIAPGGMALYEGTLFPDWRGDLFVAALAEKSLRRVALDKGLPVSQEVFFTEQDQRIRDVRVGPDGALYLLTDEKEGKLLRVVPE
jgi:aldose sugar dehydrogenase